jgi:hypothetical protein
MEFQAYIVIANMNSGLKICYTGIAIFFICPIVYYIGFSKLLPPCLLLGLALVIIGAMVTKGDFAAYIITEKILTITVDSFQVGTLICPVKELSNIVFHYDSFNNQSFSGNVKYGISNTVSFNYMNQSFELSFSLANKAHADNFLGMLNELKSYGIPFKASGKYFPNFD